jgi:hypothetical protein
MKTQKELMRDLAVESLENRKQSIVDAEKRIGSMPKRLADIMNRMNETDRELIRAVDYEKED